MTEFVSLSVDAGVGTIRIDRPPMNALNRQIQGELLEVAGEAATRADVRAVVVYGGEKTFAAGADVKEMASMSYADMAPVARRLSAGLGAISTIPKPTVAAVTGYALGGGLEVVLGADRRIAGDNVKLGFPEILLGIFPGGGGTQRTARLIGPSRTKDLIYTGRMVPADEALAIGLVDEVVGADEVYARAVAWAAQFTSGPALAYAAAKKAIDNGLDTDLRTGLDIESELFAGVFASDDARTGMASFVENGPGKATFTGR
ncbi:enoyl-CoA hydratase/isomerase family protein [Pseudonocardia sp. HH130630-07]|uniref:enoyl-CoA hydratase/isomerase family protein n=1 Tax=Pseudonocardia sp. HH130630-07 TaxID=1690815 RepID=UPI0008153CD3|nr:enoyl-CoA hydratase/isomerase family protein [Pseudonocardia sp. HH130630-07]ANY05681.1 enoyl-CoA hydratase [Pseudonocardia sp. HH130630-07]